MSRWIDDMGHLGEYFAEFSRGDLAAVGPRLDLGDEVPTLTLQKYLNRRGYRGANSKALKEDGAWGNNTEFALKNFLTAYNKQNNAAAAYETLGAGRIILTGGAGKVILAAVKLQGAAPTPPAAIVAKPVKATTTSSRPTEASKPGMVQTPVATIQALLKANGLKVTADGSWGPTTQRLWQALAAKRGLDSTINRAGPDSAWVMPQTVAAFSAPAATASAPSTVSADIVIPVASIQKILKARGVSSFGIADGKYGPKTAAAWSAAASAAGLSPAIARVTGTTARVARAAVDALSVTAPATTATIPTPVASTPSVPTAPVEPVQTRPGAASSPTVAVLLTVVQKAWNRVVQTNPSAGKPVTVTGKWDAKTANALSKLTGVSAGRVAKLLNRKKTAAMLAPTKADQLGQLAQAYESVQSQTSPAPTTTPSTSPTMANVAVSVAKIQQALNAFNGRVDDLLYPVTGEWDDKTKVGYMTMASIPVSGAAGLDQLVSSDRKTVMAASEIAKAVDVLAARWESGRARQAQADAQVPQTSQTQQAPAPQRPAPQVQQEQTFAPVAPPQQESLAPIGSDPNSLSPFPLPPPPPMPEMPAAPPTEAPAASATPESGSNAGLIVGGIAVAASLLYFVVKRRG